MTYKTAYVQVFGLVLASVLLTAPVAGQAPEGATVKLVIPGAVGGTADAVARYLAQPLAPLLKRPVIVDNRPGAAGNIAADLVAKAPADGTTALLAVDAMFTTNPHLYKSTVTEGLSPLLLLGNFSVALVVHNSMNVQTLQEFVAHAKSRPGTVTYATSGVGTTAHLIAETLSSAAGIELLHIPYKGVDGMSQDFLGSRLQSGFYSLSAADKLVKANAGRMIAISDARRVAAQPAVPTMAETYPGVVVESWLGVFTPSATPIATNKWLRDAFVSAMQDEVVAKRLSEAGFTTVLLEAKPFADNIAAERTSRGALIKRLNMVAP